MLLVLSVVTLLLLYKVYKCAEIRKMFSIIEKDLQVILLFGYGMYMAGSVNASMFFGFKVVSSFVVILLTFKTISS